MKLQTAILVILFLGSLQINLAQTGNAIQKLKVGDKAPALSAFKWIKGTPVTEFEKGRVYVIEFGSTWCKPCAASIPVLTALAEKHKDDATVISFFIMEFNSSPAGTKSPAYVAGVEQYVEKQEAKIKYNVAVDGPEKIMEDTWPRAAGKVGIPYTFVIDKTGRIAWIDSNPALLDSIVQVVNGKDYDLDRVIAQNEHGSDKTGFYIVREIAADTTDDTLQISFLSEYKDGEPALDQDFVNNFRWSKKYPDIWVKRGKIETAGASLRRLYYIAYGDTLYNVAPQRSMVTKAFVDTIKVPDAKRSYGKYWYRPLLEMKDSSVFESTYKLPKNRYDYFLKVPLSKASSGYMQMIMQHDLATCFGYRVTVEERMMPCWRLIISSEEARAKLLTRTPGKKYRFYRDESGNGIAKNAEVRDIIGQLEIGYGSSREGALITAPGKQPPFIDATGIKGDIDYSIDSKMIDKIRADRKERDTFEDYRILLRLMGIELVKGMKSMKVVVIREPKSGI